MQTTSYKLNVTPGGVPLTIHISQYDVGLRQYTFQPYTNVGEFTYVSGATVTLEATKPDGYAVIHSCEYNQDGSITYTIQEQLAAKPGRVWSKVVIRDGADVLGTGAVLWIVDYAGVKDDAIISDSDISGLEAYVDQLKTLVGVPIAVTTAAGMTDHEKLYLYEGSETGYTAGDWYYWNGSAWTSGGEYGSGAVEVDPTLSIAGEAADAKATGDGLAELKSDITAINTQDRKVAQVMGYSYPPSGFTWQNNPLKGKIRNTYKGVIEVDYDVSVNDPSSSGVTYYVDSTNGLNSNDGLTPQTAFKNMSTAFAKNDISCMVLKGGLYPRTRNLYNTVIEKTIAIKGTPGEEVIIANHSATVFTADTSHTGTYYGTRGNCSGVIDTYVRNADGDPTIYEQVDQTSEVYSTPGTWALISGTFYVHTLDNRQPDETIIQFASGNNLVAEGSLTLYLENVKVYGGASPLRATAKTSADHLKVYAKNCDFYYTYTTDNDCVMMQGVEESIFQNCKAKYALKDGFNYHAEQGILPKAIEINCIGAYCGNTDDNNDQGSTIHDGGSAIRVGCMYHDLLGSNVADQGSGTESWNVGCTAYHSLVEGNNMNCNFFAYSGVNMWLESCVGFGSTNNVYAYDETSTVALRNCNFEGKLTVTGHEVEYY